MLCTLDREMFLFAFITIPGVLQMSQRKCSLPMQNQLRNKGLFSLVLSAQQDETTETNCVCHKLRKGGPSFLGHSHV